MQAGITGEEAAVAVNVQTSSGDGSAEPQNSAEQNAPAERKGGQGSPRTGTLPAESDSRYGMGGWVASAQHISDPATQRADPEAALSTRSGMTNLGVDRIAAESSARRLTNALRSEMSFGVQTYAFGKINIQAVLHGDQLASQISLEHAHLNASLLAAHMPVLELRLGEKYNLDATVTVRDSGTAMSGRQQSSSQQNSRQNTEGEPVQKVGSAIGVKSSTAPMLSQERQQTQERPSRVTGRLDLLI